MQTGVVALPGGSYNPFYEVITPTSDTHEVRALNTVQPKDEIIVTLNYYANGYPGQTTYPTTRFFFEDLRDYTTYTWNVNSTNAFDGRSAEAIDERHTYNGVITALRVQQFNGIATGTYWSKTDVSLTPNGATSPMRSYGTHREVTMTQHGTSAGPILESSTAVASQQEGTLNAWQACGVPGT